MLEYHHCLKNVFGLSLNPKCIWIKAHFIHCLKKREDDTYKNFSSFLSHLEV
ncbi:hypothetical protein HanIR_Chr12g0607801 [Helianthus annuus]|nr:hypothetical protein HanIR_Chr12g0607801 [Helianthus annuus]